MSLYFFHVFENGERVSDDVGVECDSDEAVREQAMRALPDIAKDGMRERVDQQAFTVLAMGENGEPVYTATLTFAGLWLKE